MDILTQMHVDEKRWQIPLPDRPGTMWEPETMATPHIICKHCHQHYDKHGADEQTAAKLGVDKNWRHKICPASEEDWAEYWRLVRISTYEGCRLEIINILTVMVVFKPDLKLKEIFALLPETING